MGDPEAWHPSKEFDRIHKMIKGCVDNEAMRGRPRYDPNEAGVALIDMGERSPRGGQNGADQDMTGIKNKADKSGCNHCRDKTHWMDNCPHLHVTSEALEALRKKNTAAPQLLHAGEEKDKGGESDNDHSLGELEGVALVSPAAGIVVRLDPDKLYLDNCARHTQTFLEKWLMGTYETQIGLNTISNGGQKIVSESGKLLGALQVWLVRNGRANLLSLPEFERLGFRITYDTLEEWVGISSK